eukprot:6202824-Pleurochrysis_carterae.AAC.2
MLAMTHSYFYTTDSPEPDMEPDYAHTFAAVGTAPRARHSRNFFSTLCARIKRRIRPWPNWTTHREVAEAAGEEGGEPVATRLDSSGRDDGKRGTIVSIIRNLSHRRTCRVRSVQRSKVRTSEVMCTKRNRHAGCAASQGIQRACAIGFTCSHRRAARDIRPRTSERVKQLGVQIDGKRVANFAHLSDLDNSAPVEVEQALPVGEIFQVNEALEVLEEALDRAEPGSGEIEEVVARMDISASEEEDADGEGRLAGAYPRM